MPSMSGHKDTVNSVTFNPGGTLIVSSSDDKSVRLWDVSEGKLISTLNNHRGAVNSVVFSHDGSAMISGSEDGTIGIWGSASD